MEARPGARPATMLAAVLATVAIAFMAGCAGPRQRPQQFSPMPLLGQMERADYRTILGPVSGRGSKTFIISARPGIAEWLGCIGKGMAVMTRPYTVVAICGHVGNAFVGGTTQPTHDRRGQKLTVRITAPATVRWEFRIDGAPWAGARHPRPLQGS